MMILTRMHTMKVTGGLLSSALAALLLGGCHRDPNVAKQKYLESGTRYYDQGKYKEATIQLSNALKIDHNFAAAHYELAKTFLKTEAVMQAYAELSRTVDLQPSNVKARIDLGNLLLAGGASDRAVAQANAVLAIDSNNADAYALLATAAAMKGDRATALTDINKALSLDPGRASFHATLGMIESSSPNTAGNAEDQLRKAVELDPKNVNAHLVLASLLAKKGDVAAAIEQIKGAIAGDPKNIAARGALAQLYLEHGQKAEAEQTLLQTATELGSTPQGANMLRSYYMSTGQVDRAETVYAGLVSKDPKSAPLKIAYTRILLAKHDVPKAKSEVAELLKSDGADPEVAVLNSMLLLNDGKNDEAMGVLQKAAKNNPQSLEVKLWLGRAAGAAGNVSVAEQSYKDAALIAPRSVEAQDGLAQIALGRKDYNLLSQVANTTMSIAPQYANPYLWRGIAEANQNQKDRAETDFRQALKLNPSSAAGNLELGQLLLEQEHVAQAKPLLEQALEENPGSVQALQLLNILDMRAKQPEKAIARTKAQIAKLPQFGPLYDQLAELQLATTDKAGALASADQALKLNANDESAVMIYSRAVIANGDPGKAVSAWQQWIAAHPKDADANAMLGSLVQSQGDKEKAMTYYKQALALQPDQPVAANNLAYLMIETGQSPDVALSLAQTARRLLPNAPSTADTLGWAYYQHGTYYSARDLLEEAVKSAPDDPTMQYHLGMTYSKLNDKSSATLHLKKAATLAPNSPVAADANKELASLG